MLTSLLTNVQHLVSVGLFAPRARMETVDDEKIRPTTVFCFVCRCTSFSCSFGAVLLSYKVRNVEIAYSANSSETMSATLVGLLVMNLSFLFKKYANNLAPLIQHCRLVRFTNCFEWMNEFRVDNRRVRIHDTQYDHSVQFVEWHDTLIRCCPLSDRSVITFMQDDDVRYAYTDKVF